MSVLVTCQELGRTGVSLEIALGSLEGKCCANSNSEVYGFLGGRQAGRAEDYFLSQKAAVLERTLCLGCSSSDQHC